MTSSSLSSVARPQSLAEAYVTRDLYARNLDVQPHKYLDQVEFRMGTTGTEYVGAPPRTPNEERKRKKKSSKRMVKCAACGHCLSQTSYSGNQWTKPRPVCRNCIKMASILVYSLQLRWPGASRREPPASNSSRFASISSRFDSMDDRMSAVAASTSARSASRHSNDLATACAIEVNHSSLVRIASRLHSSWRDVFLPFLHAFSARVYARYAGVPRRSA
jgi:hypothetical protein